MDTNKHESEVQTFPGEIVELQTDYEDGDLVALLSRGHVNFDSFRLACEKHLLKEYGKAHPFKVAEIKHEFRRCIPHGEFGEEYPEAKRKTGTEFPATVAKIEQGRLLYS